MLSSIVLAGILLAFIKQILFAIESLECRALDVLYNMFKAFSGISPVFLDHKETTLLDVFFSNDLISTVYWGMACIGFALTFGFAIAALIRKIFDSTGEKVKATIGQILTNTFKAILLIILMTAIVSATITGTTTLLTAVDDLFNNAAEINSPTTINFDDEDFANMFKILDIIGNHAVSPAYESRFNINSCYNEIRPYMQPLHAKRMFEYSYVGAENSWQYALTQLYHAGDIYQDVKLDVDNESISRAILDIITLMKTNKDSFKPLKTYTRSYSLTSNKQTIGRIMMLSCSFGDTADDGSLEESPTLEDSYNEGKASFEDPLRRPYYVGEKDIYSYSKVTSDFSYGLTSWNHLVNILGVYFLIKEFLKIAFNCIARIFNLMVLYISAPGFISVMPLDDGGKFKQWTTSFVIQSLSIFGSVIAVRILMIMIPVVLSPSLVIFTNSVADILAKDVIVMGMCMTCEKANGLIGGILADNAGYQSILAGEVGGGIASSALALGGRLAMGAAKAGAKVGTSALSGLSTVSGLGTKVDKIGEGLKNIGTSMRQKGGIVGAAKSGFTTKEQDSKKAEAAEKEADKKDTADYRAGVLSSLGSLAEKMGGAGGGEGKGGSEQQPKQEQNDDKKDNSEQKNGNKDVAKNPPINNFQPQMNQKHDENKGQVPNFNNNNNNNNDNQNLNNNNQPGNQEGAGK